MGELKPRERIVLRVVSSVLLLFWGAIGFYILSSTVPDSPVLPGRIVRQAQFAHFPQGWAFFTRNPREETVTLFRPAEAGWSAVNMRNASAETFFGLRKGGAVNGMELGMLVQQVREWNEARLAWEQRLPLHTELVEASTATIKNLAAVKSLCGEWLLFKQAPVPWAWARSGAPVKLPASFKKVNVECE